MIVHNTAVANASKIVVFDFGCNSREFLLLDLCLWYPPSSNARTSSGGWGKIKLCFSAPHVIISHHHQQQQAPEHLKKQKHSWQPATTMYIDTQQQTTTSNQASGASTMILGYERPYYIYCSRRSRQPPRRCTYVQGFRFARKLNSGLCMSAPYVQVRTKRRLRCPDQPDPRPNPNPNPKPNPSGGSRCALAVGRGSQYIEFTCKSKNLARTYVRHCKYQHRSLYDEYRPLIRRTHSWRPWKNFK